MKYRALYKNSDPLKPILISTIETQSADFPVGILYNEERYVLQKVYQIDSPSLTKQFLAHCQSHNVETDVIIPEGK